MLYLKHWLKCYFHSSLTRDIYYSVLFNQGVRERHWLDGISINSGRWSVDYCYLYVLYNALQSIKPQNILDLGLGQTSLLFFGYKKAEKEKGYEVSVQTVEHDQAYIDFFRKTYENACVSILKGTIIKGDYHLNGFTCSNIYYYSNFLDLIEKKKFDLISIDGPYGSAPVSRPNIIEIVENDMLADDFVIMFDDCNRKADFNTANIVFKMLNRKGINCFRAFYFGQKMHCIITTEKYRILTTL